MTDDDRPLLAHLERYYDTAPRAMCDVEEVGPFTLFLSHGGFPFYARPRLGGSDPIRPQDVTAVRDRQVELGVPESIEWVHQSTPSLLGAARAAGMHVAECPLLVLAQDPPEPDPAAAVRVLSADDPDLGLVRAAIDVGFANAGTARGTASVAERDERVDAVADAVERVAALIAADLSVLVGAFDTDAGPVGGGSHNPRGDVTEVVGVGVLPAYRRRGLAAAITARLARNALDGGVRTVFCSAEDEDVARVYGSVGFRRVGTACIAEIG